MGVGVAANKMIEATVATMDPTTIRRKFVKHYELFFV